MQKEWIIACNTDYYDLDNALSTLKIIDWQQPFQMKSAEVGDLVYIYCKGIGICYKGAILEVNKYDDIIDDSQFQKYVVLPEGPYFTVAMFRDYSLGDELTYASLKEAGLKSRLQGPILVKGSLADYLHKCDEIQRNINRFDGTIPSTCLADFPIKIHEIKTINQYYNDNIEENDATSRIFDEVRSGKRRAWLLAPGEKGCMMEQFVEKGIAAIDWCSFDSWNLKKFKTQEEIAQFMRNYFCTNNSYKNDSLCLYQFSREIKKGDIIFCKGGLTRIIGLGIVTGTYFHVNSDELGRYSQQYGGIVDTYKHRIKVDWISNQRLETGFNLPQKTLTKLTVEKIDALSQLYDGLKLEIAPNIPVELKSEEEIIEYAKTLSLNKLKKIAESQQSSKPKELKTTTVQKVRNPYIAEYAKRRANGICQLCKKKAPFMSKDGEPYLESHHIIWLMNGGEDTIENTVALCPNCHRKMHIVNDPSDIKKLKKINR